MAIELSSAVLAGLLAEAAVAHPRECCGVLLGDAARIAAFVPAANVHPDPKRRFEIDPAVLIAAHRAARAGGPGVAGYYHSHPNGRAAPSATDRLHAAGDGLVWAIVAAGAVTLWRDEAGGFIALPYQGVNH